MLDSKAVTVRGFAPSFWMKFAAVSVLVVAGAATTFASHAQEHGGPAMERPGGGPGMLFGGAPEHVARGIDRMLDGLGVTDAQRAQIRQIAMTAASDLRSQRMAGRSMRDRGLQIFTAPTVDAAAAESLRQQMSAQADAASKRRLQAMLDIARVLTPEQRARIGDRMKERQAVMQDRMQRMDQEHAQRMQDRSNRMAPSAPAAK